MKKNLYDTIVTPIITEKATRNMEQNKYTFKVSKWANKTDIKTAIETIYKVNVRAVNVINVKGKTKSVRGIPGKTASWKKALITLKDGQKIEFV